jgi:hypothetical protein
VLRYLAVLEAHMLNFLSVLVTIAFSQPGSPTDTIVSALPSPPIAVLELAENLTILSADHHLLSYSLQNGEWVLQQDNLNTTAVGLFSANGQVWVESIERSAYPIGNGPSVPGLPIIRSLPGSSKAGTLSKTSNTSQGNGSVITASVGEIVIDLGTNDGIEPGVSIKVIGERTLFMPAPDGTKKESTVLTDVATGWVKASETGRSLVTLARGSRANTGDSVEVVPEGVRRVAIAPARMAGVREFGVKVRPFLALDNVGVGFINETWMTWNHESPWYTEVRLSPMGLGWSADGNVLSVAALGTAGFDSRWFRVGLGAGWSMLNNDASNYGYQSDYALAESGSFSQAIEFVDVTNAPSIVQFVRLGAEDGLHLSVRNTFILTPSYAYNWVDADCTEVSNYGDGDEYYGNNCGYYETEDVGSEFVFGGLAMRLSVPTGPRTNLIMDWGTGRSGAGWFEAGVDVWVKGNGDAGSVSVEAAAGFGSLVAQLNDEYINLYGPMVSGGARWRF